MLIQLKIDVPQHTFLKNPQESKLGEQIFQQGIVLMNDLGFEQFTFKKLAIQISSSEVSIYRYFESKHHFLQYLFAWYWGLVEHKIHFATVNLNETKEGLDKAINILLWNEAVNNMEFQHEKELKEIIKNEGFKAFLIKNIDQVNSLGVFENYKKIVDHLSNWLIDLCPEYPYPKILISNIIEGSIVQDFYSEHLPRLTNTIDGKCQSASYFLNIYEQVFKDYGRSNK
ncbi:MAG: TetR/AcrR family transcriptional regulator [Fluviicola sp.]